MSCVRTLQGPKTPKAEDPSVTKKRRLNLFFFGYEFPESGTNGTFLKKEGTSHGVSQKATKMIGFVIFAFVSDSGNS